MMSTPISPSSPAEETSVCPIRGVPVHRIHADLHLGNGLRVEIGSRLDQTD
jgi:hypothetical protein